MEEEPLFKTSTGKDGMNETLRMLGLNASADLLKATQISIARPGSLVSVRAFFKEKANRRGPFGFATLLSR